MLSWKNIREGSELLRVSRCGRFTIKRLETLSRNSLYQYRYQLIDCDIGRQEELGTLQEARKLAEQWSLD